MRSQIHKKSTGPGGGGRNRAEHIRGAAISAMRRVVGAFERDERQRAMERLGAVAARLVGPERQGPALVEAVERGHGAAADAPAVRAVDSAILAVAMARRVVDEREALLRVATAALSLELSVDPGRQRSNEDASNSSGGLDEEEIKRIWDDSGIDSAPGIGFGGGDGPEFSGDGGAGGEAMGFDDVRRPGSIALSTLFGAAIDDASLRRAVTAFEAAWLLEKESLGWPHHNDYRPSVEAIVVATARRWVDLRRGGDLHGPRSPQRAVEALFERIDVVAERVALDILLSTVGFLARGMQVQLADGRRGVVVEPGEAVDDYLNPVILLDGDDEEAVGEGRPGSTPGFPPVVDVLGFQSMPSNSLSLRESLGERDRRRGGVDRRDSTQPYAGDDSSGIPVDFSDWDDEEHPADAELEGAAQTRTADDYLVPELEDIEFDDPADAEVDSEAMIESSPTQEFDDGELGTLVDACTDAECSEMSSGIEEEAQTQPVPDEQAWELMSRLVDEIDEEGLFPEDGEEE